MSQYLQVADITLFIPDADSAQVQAVIDDAEAILRASVDRLQWIPAEDEPIVKAVLRQAIIRWLNAGDGSVVSQSAPGGYSQTIDTSRQRRGFFFDDELARIRGLVPADPAAEQVARRGRAFTVDMLGSPYIRHEDGCSIYWGGLCSCSVWWGPFTNQTLPAPSLPIVAGEEP